MPTATTVKEVSVKVTGGVNFAAVSVDAQGVPLYRKSKSFLGKHRTTLSPDTIDCFYWVKGGTGASFKVELSINQKSKAIEGVVDRAHEVRALATFPFSDFDL